MVDIGCGKGRFITQQARHHPDMNFLGIERLLARVRKAEAKALRAGLTHIRFLRVEAGYALRYLLPAESVTAYTLFFPDPWPKRRHRERRLVNAVLRDQLYRTLRPDGCIHFATDHADYYEAVTEGFDADARFQPIAPWIPPPESRTVFETHFTKQGVEIRRAAYAKLTGPSSQRRDAGGHPVRRRSG